jgi:hypothetical protein
MNGSSSCLTALGGIFALPFQVTTPMSNHAFRRFRESVLLKSECRQILIDYWMGHENPDMSTRYGRQLVEDVKYRKEWAEKVGLGFELPQVSEPHLDVSCATCATNSTEQACNANA